MTSRNVWLLPLVAVLLAVGCGTKRGPSTGTWTAVLAGKNPLTIRFVIEEDGSGQLTGQTWYLEGAEYKEADTFTGKRDGTTVSWTSETDVKVQGKFEDEKFEKFVGTIEYPGVDEHPATGGELVLTR